MNELTPAENAAMYALSQMTDDEETALIAWLDGRSSD